MTSNTIDIEPRHFKLVETILKKHLPAKTTVWVFGSRSKNTAHEFSDLDLAIDVGQPISLALSAKLNDAFEESILPYKIDVVDWHSISDKFKQNIDDDRRLFLQI